MQPFFYFFCVALICIACDSTEDIGEIPDNFIAESKYHMVVSSSLGGDHSFAIDSMNGVTTLWRKGIGHMELGPEEPFSCDKPVASLWMDIDQINLELETLTLDTSIIPRFSFYSILYWCENLGNQESNQYSFVEIEEVNEPVVIGTDSKGLRFIKGDIELLFERIILNDKDVPEQIAIDVDFVAIDR